MITPNDEARLRQLQADKASGATLTTPERLQERDFPAGWTVEASDAQRVAWDAAGDQRLKTAKVKELLRWFRKGCGRRLDPVTTTIDSFRIYEGDEATADAQRFVLDALRTYLRNLPRRRRLGACIFLIGSPGTGKDHLAVAVAREFILRLGQSARRFFVPELKSDLRDSWKKSGPTEAGIIGPAITPDVVILSDPVGKGSTLSDTQHELLFRIIDARYLLKKPTIVTANFADKEEADAGLGSQVVSRLSHGGLRLFCFWDDFRERRGKL